jgi:hypothetical protein
MKTTTYTILQMVIYRLGFVLAAGSLICLQLSTTHTAL